jgi:hypothetical protein
LQLALGLRVGYMILTAFCFFFYGNTGTLEGLMFDVTLSAYSAIWTEALLF